MVCPSCGRNLADTTERLLRSTWMGRVLGDLAACGYDAEWQSIRASDVGAPHRRERIWIIAYPRGDEWNVRGCAERNIFPEQRTTESAEQFWDRWFNWSSSVGTIVPHAQSDLRRASRDDRSISPDWSSSTVADSDTERLPRSLQTGKYSAPQGSWSFDKSNGQGWWAVEPDVGRVAHGIPARVDRLRGLGNAIVPQIAEWIGRRISDDACGVCDADARASGAAG